MTAAQHVVNKASEFSEKYVYNTWKVTGDWSTILAFLTIEVIKYVLLIH